MDLDKRYDVCRSGDDMHIDTYITIDGKPFRNRHDLNLEQAKAVFKYYTTGIISTEVGKTHVTA